MILMVTFNEYKHIKLLIDENDNIAIFSFGNYDNITKSSDYWGFVVYTPIELKKPYTAIELADAIKHAMLDNNNELFFIYDQRKNKTYEEAYYGIKGFKKAMQNKRLITVGWNDRWGKYASLDLPFKRGYGYDGVKLINLDDSADWIDFAESVIELINYDSKNGKRK